MLVKTFRSLETAKNSTCGGEGGNDQYMAGTDCDRHMYKCQKGILGLRADLKTRQFNHQKCQLLFKHFDFIF